MARKPVSGFKKKAYGWMSLALFVISLSLHWLFGWHAFKNEQAAHHQPPHVSEYVVEMLCVKASAPPSHSYLLYV